ncbi:MAG: sn-glycerol-3-phosphate ABC transporter ATP-binding protein UgpC [Bacteroidetes bacterium]|nr:sn-glycerol-3-phosphate ABC transporter ATP-binding protein UgpC [Bacteroidota bacterium]
MAEVRLRDIEKTYPEGTQALKKISFTVKDKEFVVLVGPSGCGKSTTLRMVAGLEEITEGELFIENKKVNDLSPSKRQVSMVFQNYALYPHMTAYENMSFGLKIKKIPKSEIKDRVMAAAAILEIEDILDKKPGKMSGGQRQRIAIGRAIVRRPKVFLFDEPLSNLDAKLRGQMRIELAKLHRKLDATIIYVTHDQVEAMTLGDRIVVMNKGEIMQMASPMELFMKPANKFVAEFIGTPQMNFFNGKILEIDQKISFKNDALLFDLSNLKLKNLKDHLGEQVDLGIRSEDIYPHIGDLKNYTCISTHLIAIELLGNEKLVYSEYQGNNIVARFRSDFELEMNTKVNFYLNLDKAHFFGKATGERIY